MHPGILNIRWILHFQVWRSRSGDANERLQLWRKSAKQEKCKTAVCTVAKKFRYAPIDSQYFVLTRSTFAESVKKCSWSPGAMPGGAIFDCVSRCCNWPYFLESVSKTSGYGWKLDGVRHSMSPKFQDSLYKDRFCRARQHCHHTICIELVELTNSETAAATPSGGGARSLRSHSSLETGSFWRFLVN